MRKVTESTKKRVAGRQAYKCANKPDASLKGLTNYACPLWSVQHENRGSFDEAGYEIDHINEHCISGDDTEENLQALCTSCHRVKTKRFLGDHLSSNTTTKQTLSKKTPSKKIPAKKTISKKIPAKKTLPKKNLTKKVLPKKVPYKIPYNQDQVRNFLNSICIVEIKYICYNLGIPKTGTKTVLIIKILKKKRKLEELKRYVMWNRFVLQLQVKELKQICAIHGLAVTGTKTQLQTKILNHENLYDIIELIQLLADNTKCKYMNICPNEHVTFTTSKQKKKCNDNKCTKTASVQMDNQFYDNDFFDEFYLEFHDFLYDEIYDLHNPKGINSLEADENILPNTTIKNLRLICGRLYLDSKGNKAELIARINSNCTLSQIAGLCDHDRLDHLEL